MVYFVGAGSGAEDLITVRGFNYLKQADVIIYAGSLVNPELLKTAKQDCRIYNSAYMTLEEVIAVMEEAEKEGKDTVRLHTGDPSIYGAIREQMDELAKKGIAFSVCPGVSSLFGAAASLQIEYTLPEVSQSVIITRAEGRTPVPERESIRALAKHQSTMVLFLSSGLAWKVKEELIAGGYDAETPAAVVYKATWPEEMILHTTVEKLPEDMERKGIRKTALIVVGKVLGNEYKKSKLYDASFTTEFRKGNSVPSVAHSGKTTVVQNTAAIVIIACSRQAYELMKKLEQSLKQEQPDRTVICIVKCSSLGDISDKRSLNDIIGEWFGQADAIVFISSTGIAVRAIAPYVRHKSSDPAVIAMDGKGKFCISLLSGHAGGANELAEKIADLAGAVPVITTATDLEGKFAVDDFARKNRMKVMDWEMAKQFSAGVLEGERFGIYSELPLIGELPEELFWIGKDCEKELPEGQDAGQISQKGDFAAAGIVCISCHMLKHIPALKGCREQNTAILQLVPKLLAVGIGCRKGTAKEKIEDAVRQCLLEEGFLEESLYAVASIDLKEDEAGLLSYCQEKELAFFTYSAQELGQAEGKFSESSFVKEVTGVACVCERSAVLAAEGGELLCHKKVYDGVTVALAARKGKGEF